MLDFTRAAAMEAGSIFKNLKAKGLMINIEDILIGAIARSNNLRLATDNVTHFSRMEHLHII